jgi:hypothetical protein
MRKKIDRPGEVKRELDEEQQYRKTAQARTARGYHHGQRKAHHDVQDRPGDAERRTRRLRLGLYQRLEPAILLTRSGKIADSEAEQNDQWHEQQRPAHKGEAELHGRGNFIHRGGFSCPQKGLDPSHIGFVWRTPARFTKVFRAVAVSSCAPSAPRRGIRYCRSGP